MIRAPTRTTRRATARPAGIAVWATAVGAVALRAATLSWPAPSGVSAEGFSAARASAAAEAALGGWRPRPAGSPAAERALAGLREAFDGLGYRTEVQRGWACHGEGYCARVANLVATRAGAGGGYVAVAAHYDTVAASPGVADNGAGVAVALELARTLATRPLEGPGLLFLLDVEEVDLLGATWFAARDPRAGRIEALVNLEARGTSAPAVLFEAAGRPGALLRGYARAPRPAASSLFPWIYEQLPNTTDVAVLGPVVGGAVNLALIGEAEDYHNPQDAVVELDLAGLRHLGDAAAAAVDGALGGAGGGAAVDFADLLGVALLVWPRWLTGLAAVAALGLSLAARPARPLRAVLSWIGVALAGAAAGGATWAGLSAVGAADLDWGAEPTGPLLAAVAGGAAAGALAAWWGSADPPSAPRRTTPAGSCSAGGIEGATGRGGRELGRSSARAQEPDLESSTSKPSATHRATAAALAWAVAAAVAFGVVPGGAYLVTLPALVVAAGAFAGRWAGDAAAMAGCSVGSVVAAVLLASVGAHLYDGVGAGAAVPLAASGAIVVHLGLAAALHLPRSLAVAALLAWAAVTLVAALTADARGPGFGAPANLRAARDGDRCTLARDGAAPTGDDPLTAEAPYLPWLPDDRLPAVAVSCDPAWTAPELAAASAEPADGAVRLRLRLRSPRGASTLRLALPPGTRATAISVDGDGPWPLAPAEDGVWQSLRLDAVPPRADVDVVLLAARAPDRVWVGDQALAELGALVPGARGRHDVPLEDGDVTLVHALVPFSR
jgi:hypothetical protein